VATTKKKLANKKKRPLSPLMQFRAELRAAAKAGRPARLRGVDIQLHRLDLSEAPLRNADLRGANLRYCHVRGADFSGADLRSASLPSPSVMLTAYWPNLDDDKLVRDLMRYDAENHENPDAFETWAAGGPCPYEDSTFSRAANFNEDTEAFKPGRAPRAYDLIVRVFKAAGVKWGRI